MPNQLQYMNPPSERDAHTNYMQKDSIDGLKAACEEVIQSCKQTKDVGFSCQIFIKFLEQLAQEATKYHSVKIYLAASTLLKLCGDSKADIYIPKLPDISSVNFLFQYIGKEFSQGKSQYYQKLFDKGDVESLIKLLKVESESGAHILSLMESAIKYDHVENFKKLLELGKKIEPPLTDEEYTELYSDIVSKEKAKLKAFFESEALCSASATIIEEHPLEVSIPEPVPSSARRKWDKAVKQITLIKYDEKTDMVDLSPIKFAEDISTLSDRSGSVSSDSIALASDSSEMGDDEVFYVDRSNSIQNAFVDTIKHAIESRAAFKQVLDKYGLRASLLVTEGVRPLDPMDDPECIADLLGMANKGCGF